MKTKILIWMIVLIALSSLVSASTNWNGSTIDWDTSKYLFTEFGNPCLNGSNPTNGVGIDVGCGAGTEYWDTTYGTDVTDHKYDNTRVFVPDSVISIWFKDAADNNVIKWNPSGGAGSIYNNACFAVWVYMDSTSGTGESFVSNVFGTDDRSWANYIWRNTTLGTWQQTNITTIKDEWVEWKWCNNSNNWEIYFDNTLGVIAPVSDVNNVGYMRIQNKLAGPVWFDGFRIWNYSLYGIEGPTNDNSDNLNISTPNPINATQFNTSSVEFNITINSTYDFNYTLYIDGVINRTDNELPSGVNQFVDETITFTDGTHNYSFYVVQFNDTTQNETTSTNIFYVDTVNPTIDNTNLDGNNTYWTNELNLNMNVSDTNIYSIMINDSCGFGYYNDSISSPYNYVNASINITGCGVGQQQTNVTVCDGHGADLNCITNHYLWYSRSRLNITAFTMGGGSISNFSIYVNGTLDGSTTTGYYYLDNLTFEDYNITIDNSGYELKSEVVTINLTYQEFNMSFYTTNSINFIFRDEETKALINNVSFELISDVFANNYSTTNGTDYLDLLSPIEYSIRYVSDGYLERFYYFNLQNRTHTNLTLYLVSNSTAQEVTGNVYDEGNHLIEDAYIKVLRFDLTTNAYLVQEIMKTNFEGQTMLHLILNDEFYKFIIEYPLGTIVKETSPTYIYATNLNFQIQLGEDIASNFYNSQDVSYSLIFNNNTNNFRFTYSDANNIVSQGCLKVYRITSFKESLYNSTCVSSATSTILINVANITGATYRADAFVYFGEDEYYLISEYKSFDTANIGGNFGVFLIIILMILFVFVARWSKPVALILTPLPLFFGSILNIIDLSIGITLPLEIVCVIVAIWVSKR